MTPAIITLVALSIGGYIVIGGLVYQALREAWEHEEDAWGAATIWPLALVVLLLATLGKLLWLDIPSAIMTRVRRRRVPTAKVVRRG